MVGGVMSVLQGDKFGHGFASAAVGKALTLGARGLNLGDGGRFMSATLGGGTGSVITGGKFANGAATAALAFVANDLATDRASAQKAQQPKISSATDKQGNITYTRGKGTVVVNNGVTVKDANNGNTIADVLTVSEKIGKTVYVISGHRAGRATSEHYRVAVDFYVPGQTSATTPTLRDTIHNMSIFNRVASYHNKNTVHVDYKSTGNQGRFHDGGKGWVHIP